MAGYQLVLTNKGLVPIEKVIKEMKFWDNLSWVSYNGVIYKGERVVITYDGLTATSDHSVLVEEVEFPVTFEVAANNKLSLVETGIGSTPIQLGSNFSGFISKVTKKSKSLRHIKRRRKHRFTILNKLVHNCGYEVLLVI